MSSPHIWSQVSISTKSKTTLAAEDISCPITQLVKPLQTLLHCGTLNFCECKALSTSATLEKTQITLKHALVKNYFTISLKEKFQIFLS